MYDRYKKYFNYLNTGWKGKQYEIFAYNGGLFTPDEILDSVVISDVLLQKHTRVLTAYDFETDVDVNILGNIFENSLNEIEEITAQIGAIDSTEGLTPLNKRKKDGIFYTPKYITKYIVENTVGKLCDEKKTELAIKEGEYLKSRKGRPVQKLKELDEKLTTYRNWLLTLTICDPACGSGAFLNQALDFLIHEHHYIDELKAKLLEVPMIFTEVENSILENNIFGVDINEESVEIAKLSLWLRTAQKGRKLTTLSNNVKCGNSLIDDPEVAGEKAFNWQNEFPGVFRKKNKKAWHITTATHNSRTSQRMWNLNIEPGEAVWLDEEKEVLITRAILEIVKEDKLNVLQYNICGDHMHIMLVCEKQELNEIVAKIKGRSSYFLNRWVNPSEQKAAPKYADGTRIPTWTRKFNTSFITSDEKFHNTIEYIKNNRQKHQLPENNELQTLVEKMICTREHAFRNEYNGGFDVVIGNPPYGAKLDKTDEKYLRNYFKVASYQIDTYILFIEKSISLVHNYGKCGLIIPSAFVNSVYDIELRNFLLNKSKIEEIVIAPSSAFQDATVETLILTYCKEKSNHTKSFSVKRWDIKPEIKYDIDFKEILETNSKTFPVYVDPYKYSIVKKVQQVKSKLNDFAEVVWGVKVYQTGKGEPKQEPYYSKEKIFHSKIKHDDLYLPLIGGKSISRYYLSPANQFLKYGKWLAEPRNPSWFKTNEKRIIVREITSNGMIQATIIDEPLVFSNSVDGIRIRKRVDFNIEYLLGILNSKLISFYHLNTSPNSFKSTFPKVLLKDLKEIPIHELLNKYQAFISVNVEGIGEKAEKKEELEHNFIKYLQSQFQIETFSKKLQNWHKLEFGEFIKELNKTIKTSNKLRTNNGVHPIALLSKTDEMEWMEVFETKKAEAQKLKDEINKTDHEIDLMVYKLYELSYEEALIVDTELPGIISRDKYEKAGIEELKK